MLYDFWAPSGSVREHAKSGQPGFCVAKVWQR